MRKLTSLCYLAAIVLLLSLTTSAQASQDGTSQPIQAQPVISGPNLSNTVARPWQVTQSKDEKVLDPASDKNIVSDREAYKSVHTWPTVCSGEEKVWDQAGDKDIVIKDGANLTVMFHGNRFSASADIIEAFERANPGIKVSYSTLPPNSVIQKLNEHNLSKFNEDIAAKIALLDYPDVVMVPEIGLKKNSYNDKLINPAMYSQVNGMIAIMRADESRISNLEDLKKADVRFVLVGMQSTKEYAVSKGPAAFFGDDLFDQIRKRPSTGFSQRTHHRSVPAHILLGCEDVGFQFAQSQAYLEKRFPGKFKFMDLPNSIPGTYDRENSYIAVTKKSAHPEAAMKFRDFVLGSEGQAILARYKLSLRK